ncbi:MAG: GFA family protein [Gammaproteobacteria bacterium]|nr:GFA family protein [Gammaproteobacteria bacterium]MDH5302619.1 GFA family protein [Gammaproteobacteria bacterium]MDH5322132.1 GFA family protein [Gammaproteobacteria bacterium]
MSTAQTISGQCLCGAVAFTISGELRPVIYCHCEQCRRSSGHYVATTACKRDQIRFQSDQALAWYQSSPHAKRGFCRTCGSSLFWVPEHGRHWAVHAGTLARPTGLRAAMHIYTQMAGDYYDFNDGLPRYEEDNPPSVPGEVE